ncbi:hypothetical protein PENTCL1PPCAC_127 [Pristionchus entomophagus]|uniref:Secreted protein n=1 Tax=Pristionchus entomophagus TaxID=358040 RepID=A0AAV5S5Z6_9BILA|nr:hypothetical protein PENTCL1PPCAC_127 [Pristionchus entomophagus]
MGFPLVWLGLRCASLCCWVLFSGEKVKSGLLLFASGVLVVGEAYFCRGELHELEEVAGCWRAARIFI